MTTTTPAREVFERFGEYLAGNDPQGELWTEDVVIEAPFALPGRPRRWEGRDQWLAFAGPRRAALPFTLRRRALVVHETADPEVIVVEYELGGTPPGAAEEMWAAFIGVLRVRDGRVAHWREYQNPIVVAAATGDLPGLLASLTGHSAGADASGGEAGPGA
ncbi:hypothetical protein Sme01_10140 [Sphaerisporangium melleum]|uniref:SnoaL-like domain-containing protein n=1 Tax=Sphaerisporangium melleum TaxID=321316 RepID=A0A917QTI5_9ACTN|nr:nuclear transport factor 2 family protein [Sphaerisporangium melleum]GGK66904.1 hypothetical protein GCM10007964_07470 [Sphaerisporangium melleum]GII68538.1 hypothetical protein Sme01_10140 [Sphaerisporangium melleum]